MPAKQTVPDPELTATLIRLAHAANPAETQDGEWIFNVVLPSTDGWQVAFFYDCGELDYIDHFVSPSGERIDVWEQDPRFEFPDADLDFPFHPLQCWRGIEDTERLLTALAAMR